MTPDAKLILEYLRIPDPGYFLYYRSANIFFSWAVEEVKSEERKKFLDIMETQNSYVTSKKKALFYFILF